MLSVPKNKILQRQGVYFTAIILFSATNFFINYWLSQKLSIDTYGSLILVMGILSPLSVFLMLGQATATSVVYFSDEKRNHPSITNEIFKCLIIMGITTMLVMLISIVIPIHHPLWNTGLIILIVSVAFAKALQEYSFSLLVCRDQYILYLIVSLTFFLLMNLGIMTYASMISFLVLWLIWGVLSLGIVIGIALQNRQKEKSGHTFSYGNLLWFGLPAIPPILITNLNTTIDRFFIKYFLNWKVLAYYGLAATFAIGAGSILVTALTRAMYVDCLKALQNGALEDYQHIIFQVAKTFTIVILCGVLTNYVFAHYFIIMIFKEKFSNAAELMFPLFIATLVNGFSQTFSAPYIQQKKIYICLISCLISFCINVIFCWILIPILGIKGAIIAVMLAAFANILASYYLALRIVKIHMPWFFILIASMAFLFSLYTPLLVI